MACCLPAPSNHHTNVDSSPIEHLHCKNVIQNLTTFIHRNVCEISSAKYQPCYSALNVLNNASDKALHKIKLYQKDLISQQKSTMQNKQHRDNLISASHLVCIKGTFSSTEYLAPCVILVSCYLICSFSAQESPNVETREYITHGKKHVCPRLLNLAWPDSFDE